VKTFLQRFGGVVLGVLCGFDRLVFRGKLRQLYSPHGMNCYLGANHVLRKDFKAHANAVTQQVLNASLMSQAEQEDRYRYLHAGTDKDAVAREIAAKHAITQGLACVLRCVEPCWTFELKKKDGKLTVQGEKGRCSQLYHYLVHPEFGWMHVRLQTWFPFEIQVYINGREWLARTLDRAGIGYRRSDNKFLWIEDWSGAQQLFDQQLQMAWRPVLDELQRQVHPLHPHFLGRLPVAYNWTVYQSEWATDIAFRTPEDLERWYLPWVRHALLNFDSVEVLRYLGRSGHLYQTGTAAVQTDLKRFYEGLRLMHRVEENSLKLYNHFNILRPELTINEPRGFKVYRTAENDPHGKKDWRALRRSVDDIACRARVSQEGNERYLEALAALPETTTVKDLLEPLCQRVTEPGTNPVRKLRALNPLAAADAELLTVISDPKWMVNGVRNRDLVEALYKKPASDPQEKRRRSARITRLLRLLRAHQLLHKVPHTHRYQLSAEAHTRIVALLAARNANPDELTKTAA
jgi:hypothetical protein